MNPKPGAKASAALPLPARLLGVAGLIPFIFGALAVASTPEIKPEAARVLLAYGAVILSFLGGIRWGFAVQEGEEAGWGAYGLSVLPPLVAWLAALDGGAGGLLLLAAALAAWFLVEGAAPPSLALPPGYMRLRGLVTAIAALSLAAAAFYW